MNQDDITEKIFDGLVEKCGFPTAVRIMKEKLSPEFWKFAGTYRLLDIYNKNPDDPFLRNICFKHLSQEKYTHIFDLLVLMGSAAEDNRLKGFFLDRVKKFELDFATCMEVWKRYHHDIKYVETPLTVMEAKLKKIMEEKMCGLASNIEQWSTICEKSLKFHNSDAVRKLAIKKLEELIGSLD